MTITIRDARSEDVPTIAAFNRAMAWETEHKELPEATIAAGVAAFLDRPQYGFYLVAEIEGRVAGCLMVTFEWSDWRNGLFWWIQSVFVIPELRRNGVFRALYQAVESRAKATPGVCGLRLYVEQENTTAQETYRSLGMTPTNYRIFEMEYP